MLGADGRCEIEIVAAIRELMEMTPCRVGMPCTGAIYILLFIVLF